MNDVVILAEGDTPMFSVGNKTHPAARRVSHFVHLQILKDYFPAPLDPDETILLRPDEAREIAAALIAAADESEKVHG